MNDTPPVPPPIPPPIPTGAPQAAASAPAAPEESAPLRGVAAVIDAVLREPHRVVGQLAEPGGARLLGTLAVVTVVCSLIYGLVVGSFSGHEQWWAAPVKITLGLFLAAAICLPSLYLFACLSGSQARPRAVLGAVLGLLMLTTMLLAGFAPVAWLFSESTRSLCWMGALHLTFWWVATLFGLRFVRAAFAHSGARSGAGLLAWSVIFILVCLQMTTTLRPLLGRAETFLPREKRFFIAHWLQCGRGAEARPSTRSAGFD